MPGNTMADVTETHSRLADIGIPAKFAVRPPALIIEARDAAVLAELADYAVRRGYKIPAALQEIASRHPHPFKENPDAKPRCIECGRSEIFSIHREDNQG